MADNQLLDNLRERYGESMTVTDCAREMGIMPTTLRNRISSGTCPFNTFLIGRKRCAKTEHVAAYLSQDHAPPVVPARSGVQFDGDE